ncbi:GNAT family N-acetyltransferase [Chlorogloeopsis sp. ULAP01]|uniref:GNAT family N-acetyltransferase n=1 Tax=Chlorogloeopsis sp. ULAP01 TaxID=3056483 RepID=UPI0025AB107A|nr:GNAT family N-acetyltransferase [Chlorogloeopsis sp. ULAP01]MDM9380736.1 GNAT family N-acetyltransferase [Chlorogloeopsis sp. ULAP01]
MWLETQRLVLREFQPADWQPLAPILVNPQVMKFSLTGILSASQTQEKIESFITSYKKFGFGKWAVILKESNELIGYCGIAVEQIDNKDETEIGYRLEPNFWGKGLATEAASAAIQYGFEQLKFPYILGIVERANTASVRVLEKLGMRYERKTIFHNVEMDVYRLNCKN